MADAFAPITGSTVTVAATTSNQDATLQSAPASGRFQVRVCNRSTSVAFIRAGGTATTSSLPVLPGSVEVFTLQPGTSVLGVMLEIGTGNVSVTCGEGL